MLITGLGNPRKEYLESRHNMGFMVIDKIAASFSAPFSQKKMFDGCLAKVFLSDGTELFLLKPQAYMNNSGVPVLRTLEAFNLKPENLIVIQDDLDLPFGTIRTRLNGSSGGHNGLKSIENHLQTSFFKRVKIGIANEHYKTLKRYNAGESIKDFVLSGFTEEEKKNLPEVIHQASLITSNFVSDPTARTFNILTLS